MAISRRHKESAEVSTESLNDIMFFLLLFFLIISTLVNPSVIKLTLPSAKANKDIVKKRIELEVNKDLQYAIDGHFYAFTELENVLLVRKNELISKGATEVTIVLHLDQGLTVQDMVDVMQVGNKLNIKMVLATKTQG
jgi:biopolymer transport protein ExbD